jgi:lysozyme
MLLSSAGERVLKNYEGFRAKPYDDKTKKEWRPGMKIVGKITVGYGHVLWNPALEFPMYKDGITELRATEIMRQDLHRFEESIRVNVTVPLEQHEYDAIVIFIFNIGLGSKAQGVAGFTTSTFLKFLNQGRKAEAGNQMLRWVYSGGQFMQGLLNRRQKERIIFLKGKYS